MIFFFISLLNICLQSIISNVMAAYLGFGVLFGVPFKVLHNLGTFSVLTSSKLYSNHNSVYKYYSSWVSIQVSTNFYATFCEV